MAVTKAEAAAKPKTTGTVLEETSQGGKYDIPPAHWIAEELIEFGVVGTKNAKAANLTGEIHPIFARERFSDLSNERYNALEQSLLLATKMLDFGMPYLASWLPVPKVRPEKLLGGAPAGMSYEEEFDFEMEMEGTASFSIVEIIQNPSEDQIQAAKAELLEIAKSVQWKEDRRMWQQNGWMGITKSMYPRPDNLCETEPPELIEESDYELREEVGAKRRLNTVGIASQYVDVLLESEDNSEQHLFAAFHAAHTMVHELGHVVYWQNFEHYNEQWVEPAAGDDCYHELGNAFIGWIFDGWYPEPIDSGDGEEFRGFTTGMRWIKRLQRPLLRPEWKIEYSMPFSSIQRIMSQEAWNELGAAGVLRPETPFRNGRLARTAVCQKGRNRRGNWGWRTDSERLHRFSDLIDGTQDPRPYGSRAEGFIDGFIEEMPPFGFVDPDWADGENSRKSPVRQSAKKSPVRQSALSKDPVKPQSRVIEIEDDSPVRSKGTFSFILCGTLKKEIHTLSPGKKLKRKRSQKPRDTDLSKNKAHPFAGNSLDFQKMSNPALIRLCKIRGLPFTGDKQTLVARIEASNQARASTSGNTLQDGGKEILGSSDDIEESEYEDHPKNKAAKTEVKYVVTENDRRLPEHKVRLKVGPMTTVDIVKSALMSNWRFQSQDMIWSFPPNKETVRFSGTRFFLPLCSQLPDNESIKCWMYKPRSLTHFEVEDDSEGYDSDSDPAAFADYTFGRERQL